MPTVVGIDLSLTSTGLAFITTDGGFPVADVSRVQSKGSTSDSLLGRRTRLVGIGQTVVGAVQRYDPNLVVIEAPSFASKYGHPHDRSGLWWMVVHSLMTHNYPVAAAPPSCRAKYATGKGNAGKDQVLTDVLRRYPDVHITRNDEADALVLAAMGMRHLGCPVEVSLPAAHMSGLSGVEWP